MAECLQAEISETLNNVFFAYIKKVLHRTARDYIYTENRRNNLCYFLEDISPQELEEYVPCSGLAAIETKSNFHIHLKNEILADIIPEFDERDREVLFLLYYQGMTATEVAAILGISQQAVSKRKHKMLERLAHGF